MLLLLEEALRFWERKGLEENFKIIDVNNKFQ